LDLQLQVDTLRAQVVAAPATYVATVRDAENYVSRLQAHGSLPSGPGRLDHPTIRIEAGKTIRIVGQLLICFVFPYIEHRVN
jgi:hypothetical protein